MKNNLFIQHGIIIPEDELVITTSRSGGPGGQHVNKADTRVSVRWNVPTTNALSPEQKERVMQKLSNRLTVDGDFIIHASSSRSQHDNKKRALEILVQTICKALQMPKKRLKSTIPHSIKEARLKAKKQRSFIKKLRTKHYEE